ncbi:MAG: PEP/pyruvate-binding domain-containing protein [Bacteroidales bacterium]|nr:PEP/pyruvate-binding domain-containing protein [Bacteroidales bacterium]
MINQQNFKRLYLKDTSFANLMTKRIFNVLLIASRYDAFMLEDDGRVDELIFNEYTSLNLRYPPRFFQVTSEEEAMHQLDDRTFDLVICMPSGLKDDSFAMVKRIKGFYPYVPIVVLTPFSREVSQSIANEDLSGIDYVFSWLGNTELLVAIIKLIEDKMNLDQDVQSVGVQVLLLVEDSIRFYSSILPHLYKFVLNQSQIFAKEALNGHECMLRMRGRPKIVLARSYEEAQTMYNKYQNNMLGIISDVSFMKDGEKDKMAGIKFCTYVRSTNKNIPLIINSSDQENEKAALDLGASFVSKHSKKLPVDIKKCVMSNFGFGDFILKNPVTGEEVARLTNLKDLQNNIFAIPEHSLRYHLGHDDMSRWLYSRAMFPIAELIKKMDVDDYDNIDECRKIIFDTVVEYRKMKNRGVVAVFQRDRFDKYSNFARIGDGSLGGKGRGLAFIDSIIKRYPELGEFDKARVTIPKTVVLCTDLFDEFMESNNLYQIGLSDLPDEQILRYFLKGQLPDSLIEDLMAFFDAVKSPVAIRSSSLLEDSHYQPFAGVYSTYMIPYQTDKYEMLHAVSNAIKGVYASVFYKNSKDYMMATQNVIDQEKMAVILQEVCGKSYGSRYYPSFSGVARSLNFYPIGDEKVEEGIANVAIGLGKYIVDGGVTLRFSPVHPHNILQMSSLDFALRETQTRFYALNLVDTKSEISTDDAFNLVKIPVKEAESDGALKYLVSTFDPSDGVIREGFYEGGRKIISFVNVLEHDMFPLAKLLDFILKLSAKEMARPVEIEYAANLDDENHENVFYLLQIRPIVDNTSDLNEDLTLISDEDKLIYSTNALGHGIIDTVQDIVYVKSDVFRPNYNQMIAYDVEKINKQFLQDGKNYILVGPGRWGSSDDWLGIPVKWPNISAARIIIESGLENYRVDPSQGTHFFQNLTSFGVGYFTVNPFMKDGIFDEAYLNTLPVVSETKYVRHVRFDYPLVAKIDGKKNIGVVLKPKEV